MRNTLVSREEKEFEVKNDTTRMISIDTVWWRCGIQNGVPRKVSSRLRRGVSVCRERRSRKGRGGKRRYTSAYTSTRRDCSPLVVSRRERLVRVRAVSGAGGRDFAGAEYLAKPVAEQRADHRRDGQQHDHADDDRSTCGQSRSVAVRDQRPVFI